ncbi:DNA-directed RNA polymerase III subunit RPC4-like isoform X3 [Miscanthus floridulus]|uniref:DNA-directed RNA polymerase III subunit RPC4-like isoform X3 n=1 Tax=Miscanthus floridulus TaxID=154761 RepID=UPI00345A6232
MDADDSSKRSRPVRRAVKKLKFKPKVPPQKPKKLSAQKPHQEDPKPIDEELMKILRTRQMTAKSSPNTEDERPTQNTPSTPPSVDAVSLSPAQFGVQKQNQLETQPDSIECEALTRPAEELDLLQQGSKERMFLFQLPKSLPLPKRPSSTSIVERQGKATGKEVKEGSNMQQLPQGYLGKMLVYKSGKIKMKLGDIMFDVSPGAETRMAQHVVALNTRDKHCCLLGEIENRHVIVTPDVDSLLNDK